MSLSAAEKVLHMLKLTVKWLLYAAALMVVAYVVPGVRIGSFGSAMLAAFVIGLLNTLVRPLLVLLTLPVTLVTLGLFLLVINALMFWATSGLLASFSVSGFWAALFGALVYSILCMVMDEFIEKAL